jgi:class 3 adenylate cyclase
LDLDEDQVVTACLHGAHEGLLLLLWDILCPICRIASDIQETLRAVHSHGRCPACNLDFELDFANSVELIFRAHPEIRDTEQKTYCVGGPAHSPHVVVQVRVAAGERLEVNMTLTEGAYRLRGPQLPYTLDFRVQPNGPVSRWDLNLTGGVPAEWPRALRTGSQTLVVTNDSSQELVVRVERTASRDDALSAARAASLALFRELFPSEVLSPGQLVRVATVTLLVTALDQAGHLYQDLGDAKAFALFREHFLRLDECIRREGGALVKTVGEGVLAAFNESAAAVRAGLALQAMPLADGTRNLHVCVGIHRGAAMAATLNGQLDYFGTTVSQVHQLPQLARGGEVILTQAVATDPEVAELLRARGLQGEPVPLDLPGQLGGLLLRSTTQAKE